MKEGVLKFCVISDSHGDMRIMQSIIGKYAGVVNNWFHCGDSELPPEYIVKDFVGVRGNCDSRVGLPLSRNVNFYFGNVHLEHGNRLEGITDDYIKSCECKFFFSGHTHRKKAFHHSFGTWEFNPGSLTRPRDGKEGSFLFIDVDSITGDLIGYEFHLIDISTGKEVGLLNKI